MIGFFRQNVFIRCQGKCVPSVIVISSFEVTYFCLQSCQKWQNRPKSPFLPFSEVIFNTLKTFAPLRPSCTFHLGPKLVVFIICYPVSHYIWFYFESEGGTLLTKIRKFWGKSCKIHNFLATGKFFTNFWGSTKFLIEWWVFHG